MLTLEKLKARILNPTLVFQLWRLAGLNFIWGPFYSPGPWPRQPLESADPEQALASEAALPQWFRMKAVPVVACWEFPSSLGRPGQQDGF